MYSSTYSEGVGVKNLLAFVLLVYGTGAAQNAAVSSYLNPNDDFAGDIRIKEVRVPQNGYTPSTYWCCMGWSSDPSGYGGMQYPSANGNNYIYSIWNDYTVPAWKDPVVDHVTFGGEGTGVSARTTAFQWSPDYWNVMADRAWNVGNHTYIAVVVKNGKTGV